MSLVITITPEQFKQLKKIKVEEDCSLVTIISSEQDTLGRKIITVQSYYEDIRGDTWEDSWVVGDEGVLKV